MTKDLTNKHILILCQSEAWGGLEVNLSKYISWLHAAGLHITVVAAPESRFLNSLPKEVQCITLPKSKSKRFPLKTAKQICDQIKNTAITHIMVGHYEQHYLCVWIALFLHQKTKLLYLQQMQLNVRKKSLFHAFFFYKMDVWFYPMHYLKTQLLQNTTLKPSQLVHLPLSTETHIWREKIEDKHIARKKLNLSTSAFVFGCIGRLDKEKGQEDIIKAAQLIYQNHTIDFQIWLAGQPTKGNEAYLATIERLISEKGLEKKVRLIPFQDPPFDFYNAIDVFIMASKNEPIGMVTLEAILMQKVWIGADMGGTKEWLDMVENKYRYAPGDVEALSKCMWDVYSNPKLPNNSASIDKQLSLWDKPFWLQTFTNSL